MTNTTPQAKFGDQVAQGDHEDAIVEALDQAALRAQVAQAVPPIPTEAQWGGLARSIMLAFDTDAKTPRKLLAFLEKVGEKIPQWLRDEQEMTSLDHVMSKGTRCTLIYRAMLAPAPPAPVQQDVQGGWDAQILPRLTVIDANAWEPCTPEFINSGGVCDPHARLWNKATCNHWHPKRIPPAPLQAEPWPAWKDEVQRLSQMASAAMHQSARDQSNILENLAERLCELIATDATPQPIEQPCQSQTAESDPQAGLTLTGEPQPIEQSEPAKALQKLADQQVAIDPDIAKATSDGFWTMFPTAQAAPATSGFMTVVPGSFVPNPDMSTEVPGLTKAEAEQLKGQAAPLAQGDSGRRASLAEVMAHQKWWDQFGGGDAFGASQRAFVYVVQKARASLPTSGVPVAEIYRSYTTGSGLGVRFLGNLKGATSDTPGVVGMKFYAAPQQAALVPLSDEQIEQCWLAVEAETASGDECVETEWARYGRKVADLAAGITSQEGGAA